jgi:glycosyltransferase involved in cell wall biosynthesis
LLDIHTRVVVRVAFSATGLASPRSGLAVYQDQLLRAFSTLPDSPDFVLYDRAGPPAFALNGREFTSTPVGVWCDRLLRRGMAKLEWFLPDFDIVHFPDVQVLLTAAPSIVTVHDLGPLRLPEMFPDVYADPSLYPSLYCRAIKRAVRHCDYFLCVSDATRSELLERFPLSPERVVAVRSGVRKPPDGFARRPVTNPSTVLMIGRVEHHKNLPVAVEAVRLLRTQGVEVELHFAGALPNANAVSIRRHCEQIAGGEWLRWHGQVDDARLWQLLEETSALLFPSFYEGFGFPALEAVTAAVPALASDIAVHRETLGGIIPLLPTDSAEAWAEGIAAIIDGRTQIPSDAAAQLERRGISWQRCAERTSQLYARVASGHDIH